MVGSAPAMGGAWVAKTVSPCSELRLDHTTSLICSTLRTVRLAIASGDRSGRPMHPSQVAGHDDPPYAGRGNEEDGARRTANEIALKDHLKVTE